MKHLRENLLVQFSVVSFMVMAAIAVVLAITLSNKIQSGALEALADEAIGASSGRLLHVITPADFEVPMTGARYNRFHEFVQQSIVSERTARIKLWAKDGTIIYSNNPAGVGEKFPNNPNLRKALRGEKAIQVKIPKDPENIRERHLGTLMEVYTPIIFPGTTGPQGVLEVYQYYLPTVQRISSLQGWVFGSIALGFVVFYAGLVSIVWRGWRTIRKKTAELQEAQERAIRAERLAAIGELSAGVAHELRNPLGTIKNATYYIKGKLRGSELLRDHPRVGEFLEILDEEVGTSNQIITDLMDFARVNPPNLSPTKLETVIDEALSRTKVKGKVKVIKELEPGLPEVPGDGEKLRRAFSNLIKNADEAMPEGGTLTITASLKDGCVELRFCDTGRGISDGDQAKVFDPLFTTKPRGIGLGLAIVKQIIEAHRGDIDVIGKRGEGATFAMRLPVKQEQRPLTPGR